MRQRVSRLLLAASVAGSASGAAGQVAQSPTIAGRSCHSAAFVPELRGVVVFGGASFCGTSVLPDSNLWVWTGASWRRLPGALPSRREDVILAYDTRRRVLVLFGGRAAGTVYSDTWEWVDSTWTRRAGPESGPGPVEHAAGAFDPSRGRVIVFGGARRRDVTRSTAVWEWDGIAWTTSSAAGPEGRIGPAMVYSRRDGGMLLYGGFSDAGSFTDLWRWDGSRWTRLNIAGPTHTEGYALVEADSGIIVIGTGVEAGPPWTRPLRAWSWRDARWTPYADAGPLGNVGRSVIYDAGRGRIVLFGGAVPNSPPSNETWELTNRRWVRPGG